MPAWLLVGPSEGRIPTPLDGLLHVNPLTITPLPPLPPGGLTLPLAVPNIPGLFCDVCWHFQTLQVDPGATSGLAFSPGLLLALGK